MIVITGVLNNVSFNGERDIEVGLPFPWVFQYTDFENGESGSHTLSDNQMADTIMALADMSRGAPISIPSLKTSHGTILLISEDCKLTAVSQNCIHWSTYIGHFNESGKNYMMDLKEFVAVLGLSLCNDDSAYAHLYNDLSAVGDLLDNGVRTFP